MGCKNRKVAMVLVQSSPVRVHTVIESGRHCHGKREFWKHLTRYNRYYTFCMCPAPSHHQRSFSRKLLQGSNIGKHTKKLAEEPFRHFLWNSTKFKTFSSSWPQKTQAAWSIFEFEASLIHKVSFRTAICYPKKSYPEKQKTNKQKPSLTTSSKYLKIK